MTTTVKKNKIPLSFHKGRSGDASEVTLSQVFASVCVRVTGTFRPHQSAATHIWWAVLPFEAAVLAGKLFLKAVIILPSHTWGEGSLTWYWPGSLLSLWRTLLLVCRFIWYSHQKQTSDCRHLVCFYVLVFLWLSCPKQTHVLSYSCRHRVSVFMGAVPHYWPAPDGNGKWV